MKRMKWFALGLMTLINLLNYMERATFAALLPAMKAELHFTDSEFGILGSAFIWSFAALSLVFGFYGDRISRTRLVAAGAAVWSLMAMVTGRISGFTEQLATRVSVGAGESAYTVVAPSLIADYFSKKLRAKVFGLYSAAVPVGYALGYLLSGLLEPQIGWRHVYIVVGVPGLFLAAVMFFLPEPARGGHEEKPHQILPFQESLRELFANGAFLCTILGYAVYTFVVGGMAFWMPTYLVRHFAVGLQEANTVFGGVTVVGGILGTLLGGLLADRLERRTGNGYMKTCILGVSLAIPLLIFSFFFHEFHAYAVVLFFIEMALFMCISPLDSAVMSFVRPEIRATAMALNLFALRCFGDGLSRALIGKVSDVYGLQTAVYSFPFVLAVAGSIWFLGLVLYWMPMSWPSRAFAIPRFQAHRGFWRGGAQENTLAAFRAARSEGAQMTELDVQLSLDLVPVVFHDKDLLRLRELKKDVRELTAAELKTVADVPSLQEVLLDPLVPGFLNIELKSAETINAELEHAVAQVIEMTASQERILFSSFNPLSLRRISRFLPNVPRALLVTEENDPKNKIYLKKMFFGAMARAHLIHPDQQMVTPKRLRSWKLRGLKVVVWTVNDPVRLQELQALPIDGIISDRFIS